MIVQLDEGYTTAEGGLGLAVGINPQYSHPVYTTVQLKCSCNNQQFMGIHGCFMNRN